LLFYDPFQPEQIIEGQRKQRTLYYQRLDNPPGYYLFSVGQDGKPFTLDDVLPPLSPDMPGMRHPPKR
jgi:hypothetical protein